jgi:hypothetical protein
VDLSRKELSRVTESKKVLPSSVNLQLEMTGLAALFQDRPRSIPTNKTNLSEPAENIVYLDELSYLCDKIEVKEPLDGLLEAVISDDVDDVTDMKMALEGAWAMDQAAILTAREKVLDEVRIMMVPRCIVGSNR